MGNHGDRRAGRSGRSGRGRGQRAAAGRLRLSWSRARALRDWPVSSRLLAVIVLALTMGLVFGVLRVADAVGGAEQFGRVAQLAQLGEQLVVLTQDVQNERDQTAAAVAGVRPAGLNAASESVDSDAARARQLAAGIGSGFPVNIQAEAASVASDVASLPRVRALALGAGPPTNVIGNYATPISDMIALDNQIAQGVSDAGLVDEVRTLTALSQAKEQASEQRALLYNTLTQGFFSVGTQSALDTAIAQEQLEESALQTTATAQETSAVSAILASSQAGTASVAEQFMLSDSAPFADLPNMGLSSKPAGPWYRLMSFKLNRMQDVELGIARNIAARAASLQGGAQRSAAVTGIVTLAVLLLVLGATLLVARSLVRPLERLRAAALDIAMTQLPERVRRIGEAKLPSQPASADLPRAPQEEDDGIAPIDVTSGDEIGQVARAFDQVHREAVRLAGNEAMLRANFNAMFVNLSRRSQLLIERLARMIDSQEQAEEDPARLSNLFSMDHLVTRMRRNSENLLLLAGHEGARKWSEPVPLADVVRAAVSEIEQYERISLSTVPRLSVEGQAVSDIVHLLAELIENATMFSQRGTQVHVAARELSSGGVLVEVADRGVGISESRLADLNWRLDNPPVIDVSVTRHMGLFAVGRLAQRHGVRVRLRAGTPQGLTALVWVPDTIVERQSGGTAGWREYQTGPTAAVAARGAIEQAAGPVSPVSGTPAPAAPLPSRSGPPRPAGRAAARASGQEPGPGASRWFRSPQTSGPPGTGARPSAAGAGWSPAPVAARPSPAPAPASPAPERTASGLPVRAPGESLAAGAALGAMPGPATPGTGSGGDRAAGAGEPGWQGAPLSPDRARSRLSGFQRGARRAKTGEPGAGEGAAR